MPGATRSDKTFLVFTCIWHENIAKISKWQGPTQCKSDSGNNMVCRHNYPVADLGGGMGGCISPHQPKSNYFGRKISLYFEKLGSISRCIPPTSLNLTISAEKSVSFLMKTFFFFFFFFFGDHLILGETNV